METETSFAIVAAIWTVTTFLINRRVEKIKTQREYNRTLQTWADIAIDLMSEADHLAEVDPQKDNMFYNYRKNLLIQLSAHIDKGRLFFPNTGIDEHGHHKPSAYKGFRSVALNNLVNCYRIVCSFDFKDYKLNKSKSEEIVAQKRFFVSVIQERLDPNKVEKEIKKIF